MGSSSPYRGLGTLLRHLIDLLDGDLQQVYHDSAMDYRPRFTPVVRALLESEPRSIRGIADHSGLTHSAASQTVAEMKRRGLVSLIRDEADGRARLVRLAPPCRAMLPQLRRQWSATNSAADGLDAELSTSLRTLLVEAIAALEHEPFRKRIARAKKENRR